MDQQSSWLEQHPALLWIFIAYVLVSGLMLFADVRRPLVEWYRTQTWLVSGSGVLDILLKQIGYRLSVELVAFGIACVIGSLGGNVYIVMRARTVERVEDL